MIKHQILVTDCETPNCEYVCRESQKICDLCASIIKRKRNKTYMCLIGIQQLICPLCSYHILSIGNTYCAKFRNALLKKVQIHIIQNVTYAAKIIVLSRATQKE